MSWDPIDRVRTIDRTGWHGQFYVLPEGSIGKPAGEKVLFLGPHIGLPIFHSLGSLEEWQIRIAARCIGNSRLIFSLSAAFAGLLLGIYYKKISEPFILRGMITYVHCGCTITPEIQKKAIFTIAAPMPKGFVRKFIFVKSYWLNPYLSILIILP
ncbi:DUF927 domain-containing protein [Candidatus Protochlamydia sp. R18]|uniref:DUF927 domain-containing protein n=1 Tax=Candidatus Protochlamydia sp. R18 TaxID=1353977 RepID=UPI0005AABF74